MSRVQALATMTIASNGQATSEAFRDPRAALVLAPSDDLTSVYLALPLTTASRMERCNITSANADQTTLGPFQGAVMFRVSWSGASVELSERGFVSHLPAIDLPLMSNACAAPTPCACFFLFFFSILRRLKFFVLWPLFFSALNCAVRALPHPDLCPAPFLPRKSSTIWLDYAGCSADFQWRYTIQVMPQPASLCTPVDTVRVTPASLRLYLSLLSLL